MKRENSVRAIAIAIGVASVLGLWASGSWLFQSVSKSTNTVRIVRARDGGVVCSLRHPSTVVGGAFSATGELLALMDERGNVELWRPKQCKLVQTWHTACGAGSVRFSRGGVLVIWSEGRADTPGRDAVELWRIGHGERVRAVSLGAGLSSARVIAVGDYLLALADKNGSISLVRLSDGSLVRKLSGYEGTADDAVFAPDGQLLAASYWGEGSSTPVLVWRVSDGLLLHKLDAPDGPMAAPVFSPNSQLLATADQGSPGVSVWKTADGELLRHLEGKKPVVFAQDGRLVASRGSGRIDVWGVDDGRLVLTVRTSGASHDIVGPRLLQPDGVLIVAGYNTGHTPGPLVEVFRLPGVSRAVSMPNQRLICFSRDGQYLVVSDPMPRD